MRLSLPALKKEDLRFLCGTLAAMVGGDPVIEFSNLS